MKKICFITVGNLYMVPYMPSYTKYLNGSYSVIFWDRENRREISDRHTYYRFDKTIEPGRKLEKIRGYIQFRRYAKKILLQNQFDIVIPLLTPCALLLFDILLKHYPGKYIFDARDYAGEKNPLVYGIEKKIVKNARACVISSEGYKAFLPPYPYIVSHNKKDLPADETQQIRSRPKERQTLHIAFIGYVNYQEQHKKLMLTLKNDPRFRLSFIGTRAAELEPFLQQNHISNVTLIDHFEPSETLAFYRDVDFVNNLYGNHTPVLDYALSNRLYYAAELEIPILVCPDTYMASVSTAYHFGCVTDLDVDGLGDKLFDYYTNIQWDKLHDGCQRFLSKVDAQQKDFAALIKQIFEERLEAAAEDG